MPKIFQRDRTLQSQQENGGVMSTFAHDAHDSDTLEARVLSVALIGPDERRRRAMAEALSGPQAAVTYEASSYPALDDATRMAEANYDVIVVDLDSDPEQALDLVEHICSRSPATVMVYSARADRELLVRSMRAGAREFLTEPLAPGTIAEALVRASVRRPAPRQTKKSLGKMLVFAGAKGGSGVTTIASNFAASLAAESGRSTILIDLDLPLGDAALSLGLTPQFSTANAFENPHRLDSNFLATLLAKHSSGLKVLAAPDRYSLAHAHAGAAARLIAVARQDFEYVVVDSGSGIAASFRELFESASIVYLVAQVSIPDLRNANRLVAEFFGKNQPQLEIVLNRYKTRSLEIDDESITKALTRPARWTVPSDFPAVHRAQNTASPLMCGKSPISKVIRDMARTACGLPIDTEKKKGFHIFG
jgi:pilus assembly protein CpaE